MGANANSPFSAVDWLVGRTLVLVLDDVGLLAIGTRTLQASFLFVALLPHGFRRTLLSTCTGKEQRGVVETDDIMRKGTPASRSARNR